MNRANIASYRNAGLAIFSLLLFGCGGGGGGGNVGPMPPALSNDAGAADITLADVMLDQIFQTALLNYTATVSLLDSTTTVTASQSDPNATMTVNGTVLVAGVTSAKITLNQGNNTITLMVTAEDGVTTNSYTIDVTRETVASFAQRAYIKASNTEASDFFGPFLALDGDTLAVGGIQEDSSATGVDGNQADNNEINSGAVYVFTRDAGGMWIQRAYIKASNTEGGDRFGESLALDGDTLVVGASREASNATGVNGDQADNSALKSGAVYVFTRDAGGVWSQQAYIKASNTDLGDLFGETVALDGDTLAVGASQEDSNVVASGAVYVFTRDGGGMWSQQALIKAANADILDRFGESLDLDGDTLAVGVSQEDSSATGVNGDQADNSAENSGAVYVYTRDGGGMWGQQAYIKASNTEAFDFFGKSLALDGDTLSVAAFAEDSSATGVNGDQADNSAVQSGAVYVFTRDAGGMWSQQAYIKASNTEPDDRFGESLALDGDALAVGATNESSSATGVNGDQADNSAISSGAVYVFTGDAAGVWRQQAYIKASNTAATDQFGAVGGLSQIPTDAVALDGDTLVAGAGAEDSSATGVGGDQADNSAMNAGAAYVFE